MSHMHASIWYYQSAMSFLVLFIVSISFCLRLLIIVAVIHHIIHWVQHTYAEIIPLTFLFVFCPRWGRERRGANYFWKCERGQHMTRTAVPPRGFWSMSCNAMPRTEEMLTKRCEQPWSRDGWSRERRDSEHVSSNTNSRAHRHVFRNINESAPIDAVITNVYHCFTAFLFDSTLCNKPKTEVVFGNLLFKKYKYEQCYLGKKECNRAFFI